jgi:drug/metabolite transporter (DMT)-like permease
MFDATRDRFGKMPGAVKGAVLMTIAAAAFAGMNVTIRALNGELHPFQVAFLRCAIGFLFMLPWLAHVGFTGLRTASQKIYGTRAFVGYASMLCWFTALASLPVAEATALSFTSPLFATVAAALLLGEIVRRRRWTATIVGFLGAMIVLRPGLDNVSLAHLLVLVSAALGGWNAIMVKQLTRTDNPNTIILYMMIYLVPLSLVPALFVWQWPSAQGWLLTLALGAFATIGHQTFTRALVECDASYVLPFDFTRLPMVAAMAYFIFAEVPDLWTWVGGAVIVSATVYIARREAQISRFAQETAAHSLQANEVATIAKRQP